MKQLTASLLSVLLLVSHLGMSSAAHYCGDYLMQHSFGIAHTEDLSCGMNMESEPISDCENNSLDKSNCCNDVIVHFEIQQDYAKADVQFSIATFVVYSNPIFEFELQPVFFEADVFPSNNYRGPPDKTGQQLIKLQQEFLI
ncbi:MAG: hypothetical protein RQ756_00520 [Flavobacteriaceae bacterium]|nr:hypothetical protein [Flavobacteriaceae bacterium]